MSSSVLRLCLRATALIIALAGYSTTGTTNGHIRRPPSSKFVSPSSFLAPTSQSVDNNLLTIVEEGSTGRSVKALPEPNSENVELKPPDRRGRSLARKPSKKQAVDLPKLTFDNGEDGNMKVNNDYRPIHPSLSRASSLHSPLSPLGRSPSSVHIDREERRRSQRGFRRDRIRPASRPRGLPEGVERIVRLVPVDPDGRRTETYPKRSPVDMLNFIGKSHTQPVYKPRYFPEGIAIEYLPKVSIERKRTDEPISRGRPRGGSDATVTRSASLSRVSTINSPNSRMGLRGGGSPSISHTITSDMMNRRSSRSRGPTNTDHVRSNRMAFDTYDWESQLNGNGGMASRSGTLQTSSDPNRYPDLYKYVSDYDESDDGMLGGYYYDDSEEYGPPTCQLERMYTWEEYDASWQANPNDAIPLECVYGSVSMKFIDLKQTSISKFENLPDNLREEIEKKQYVQIPPPNEKPKKVYWIEVEPGQVMVVKKLRRGNFQNKINNDEITIDEIDLMRTMKSEYVSRIHASYKDDKYLYLIMDYAPFGDGLDMIFKIFQIVRDYTAYRNNPYYKSYLEDRELLTCMAIFDVLRGTLEVHAHGFAQRDLKWDNTLVFTNHYAVIDFGSCIPLEEVMVADEMPAKQRKRFVGTVKMTPPEFFLEGTFDSAGDVWSLGVMAFEMVFGYNLFDALGSEHANEVMRSSIIVFGEGRLKVDNNIYEHLTPEGADFITLCLKRHADRPKDLFQLLRHPWFDRIRNLPKTEPYSPWLDIFNFKRGSSIEQLRDKFAQIRYFGQPSAGGGSNGSNGKGKTTRKPSIEPTMPGRRRSSAYVSNPAKTGKDPLATPRASKRPSVSPRVEPTSSRQTNGGRGVHEQRKAGVASNGGEPSHSEPKRKAERAEENPTTNGKHTPANTVGTATGKYPLHGRNKSVASGSTPTTPDSRTVQRKVDGNKNQKTQPPTAHKLNTLTASHPPSSPMRSTASSRMRAASNAGSHLTVPQAGVHPSDHRSAKLIDDDKLRTLSNSPIGAMPPKPKIRPLKAPERGERSTTSVRPDVRPRQPPAGKPTKTAPSSDENGISEPGRVHNIVSPVAGRAPKSQAPQQGSAKERHQLAPRIPTPKAVRADSATRRLAAKSVAGQPPPGEKWHKASNVPPM